MRLQTYDFIRDFTAKPMGTKEAVLGCAVKDALDIKAAMIIVVTSKGVWRASERAPRVVVALRQREAPGCAAHGHAGRHSARRRSAPAGAGAPRVRCGRLRRAPVALRRVDAPRPWYLRAGDAAMLSPYCCAPASSLRAGDAARWVVKYRPPVPVLVVTNSERVIRQCSPVFAVHPFLVDTIPFSREDVDFEIMLEKVRGSCRCCCAARRARTLGRRTSLPVPASTTLFPARVAAALKRTSGDGLKASVGAGVSAIAVPRTVFAGRARRWCVAQAAIYACEVGLCQPGQEVVVVHGCMESDAESMPMVSVKVSPAAHGDSKCCLAPCLLHAPASLLSLAWRALERERAQQLRARREEQLARAQGRSAACGHSPQRSPGAQEHQRSALRVVACVRLASHWTPLPGAGAQRPNGRAQHKGRRPKDVCVCALARVAAGGAGRAHAIRERQGQH